MLFVLLICRLVKSKEQPIQSLRVLLDGRKVDSSNKEDSSLLELSIPSGRYEIYSYLVESCTLDLRGNKTRIMHAEGRNKQSKPKMKDEEKNGIEEGTAKNTMFVLWNSTVSLQNVFLDSGGMGTSVGRLWSSCVLIVGSRMLSNAEMSAFVIVGGGSGVGSSVSVIDSVHESRCCGVLLPVVSSISKWLDGERSDRLEWLDVCRDGWVSEGGFSVCGVGVSVRDVDLVVGSGPLFGVWESDSRCLSLSVRSTCLVWTRLIGSKISNTTSSGCIRDRVGDGVGVGGIVEGIVGCSVLSCTNHLCGTAIVGIGDGGSVLSHNTSFTGCHTPSSPNDDPDQGTRLNEHFTDQTTLSNETTVNHVFTLCTFKDCSSSSSGGAIRASGSLLSIQIERCSFHACSSGDDGGAIYFAPTSSSSFSLSSSSFVGCSSTDYGGCVLLFSCPDLSISECVFLDSKTGFKGGAIFIQTSPFGASTGLSNTIFQNCTQTSTSSSEGGGAVRFYSCSSHKLSFVQFRQCSSASGYGHDILLYNTPFDSDSFSTCDSTSSSTHRVSDRSSSPIADFSHLLPNTTFEATVVSLDSTLTGDDTVTLTLTLDKAVSGTMIVIVSNLEGTRQEVDGKAPKIGRVLVFSFASPSSTVGTCSSTVGESELLQRPLSDYKLLAASISNHDVTVRYLLQATCVLNGSGTEVELSFSGFGIPEGVCTLTLNDSITLEVSFNDDSFGRSVGSVRKGVSGKDGELLEKTEYSLTGIMSNKNPSTLIKMASQVGFIVPTAARLAKVSVSEFLDARKTKVKLSFESVKLEKNKKYILKMKRTDSSEDPISREVWTDGNGDVLDVDEILYPIETSGEGRKEQLEFGVSYGVLSLTASDRTRSVLISDIVITMPDEPARIISLVSRSLNGMKDELTISFVSSSLPVGTGTIKVKRTNSDILVEGVLTRDSATQCTAVISTAWTESTNHLSFGNTYSVESAIIHSVDVVIDSDVSFDVPNPPVITSFSLPSECSSDSFTIEVFGLNLPSLETYTLALSDNHNISITFSESTKGRGTVKAGLPSEVQFGRQYSVSNVTKGDAHVLLNTTTFTTPLGPTLLSISTSLKSPDKKDVILSLSGLRMMTDTHNLTFHEQGQSTPITILVTIDSTTTGSGSEVIYGGTTLKYGTTYEVTSLTSDTLHLALPASLRFETDPEPSRLTSVSLTGLSDERRKADFTVGGRMMTKDETYTITVNETGLSVQKRIEVTMRTKEEGTGSGVLFSQMEGEIELDFGTEYEVVGVCDSSQLPILFEPNLRFETPSEPTRLVSFWISGYDANEKEVQFEMSGRVLETSAIFKVCLSFSNTVKHTVLMEFDLGRGKWEGSAILYPLDACQLEYGTRYTVSSFRRGDNATELFFEANEITICSEPSRLVKIVRVDDEGLNSTTLTLSSRVLTVNEQYEMKVTGTPLTSSSSSTSSLNSVHETTIKFTATSATENTVTLKLYPLEGADVKYGHWYCVDWMKVVDGGSILVETESCVFETQNEPARIISLIPRSLSGTKDELTISFVSSSLPVGTGTIKVKQTESDILVKGVLTRDSATQCTAVISTAWSENTKHLSFGNTYSVESATINSVDVVVDSGLSFDVPNPPVITSSGF
ncbi:hypothetical protein BLNAU_5981 [Blattamonas nauphoetae]|uniref:Uncharacterized protein n=1 Tax=Blattamonas nauphoetae TaxID=2049346 RepID=A0ABQ9Y5E3_9EUKA|nr:hypothetical protein BLNAU_5981 [Blattamonas nauphoetae]